MKQGKTIRSKRNLQGAVTMRWLAAMLGSAAIGCTATIAYESIWPARHTAMSAAIIPTGMATPAVPSVPTAPAVPTESTGPTTSTTPAVPTAFGLGNSTSITQAVRKVKPAVVGVVNYGLVSNYFSQQSKLEPTGVGTGVLFFKNRQDGYFVTNNHVVEGATRVEVVLDSGKHARAAVVGTDPYTDLAVLRVKEAYLRNIQPAAFANSDAIEVGQSAVAIGTPMGLDFADSVTAGIVSAIKRIMPVEDPQNENMVLDYQAVIQTDAAINPGNSGGPLLDISGQVIGINSSKIAAPSVEGMGFAIPSNEVRNIAGQIMASGHAVHPALGIAGHSLATLPEQFWPEVPVDYGVWVQALTGREAKEAGVQPADVIVSIDGHAVKSLADLRTYLFQMKPGQSVTLRLYRGNRELTCKETLGRMETMNDTRTTGETQGQGGFNPFAVPNIYGGQ